eukprot:3111221-Amphidinium_carterae.1
MDDHTAKVLCVQVATHSPDFGAREVPRTIQTSNKGQIGKVDNEHQSHTKVKAPLAGKLQSPQ